MYVFPSSQENLSYERQGSSVAFDHRKIQELHVKKCIERYFNDIGRAAKWNLFESLCRTWRTFANSPWRIAIFIEFGPLKERATGTLSWFERADRMMQQRQYVPLIPGSQPGMAHPHVPSSIFLPCS